jgi:hypothetical protein
MVLAVARTMHLCGYVRELSGFLKWLEAAGSSRGISAKGSIPHKTLHLQMFQNSHRTSAEIPHSANYTSIYWACSFPLA